MSKIVIDARESGVGGAARYVDKLIENLHALHPNHNVIILTRAERTEHFAVSAPSFTIVQTPFKEFSFNEQIGFLRQLNGLEADLVHFPMVQQPVWYRGKRVTTMQDLTTVRFNNPIKNPLVFWAKQQVYKWVNIRVARKSTALITISKFVQQDIASYAHIPPEKLTVTYEAADLILDKAEPVKGLESKQFIMYLGRPTPHKNLDRLIEAFVELKKSHPQLHLVLAGKIDANYQRYVDRVASEHIPDVTFTNYITEGQLRWLYEHCAAYAFPSLSEGFGLPALEAMLHGAPLVSTNATCSPEVYGDAAHYFDPLDVANMAARISEVLDDPILREDLIEKGKLQAAKYSWARMAEQTLAVYEAALKS